MAGISVFLHQCLHLSTYSTLAGYGQCEGHPSVPLSPLTSSGAGIILFEVFCRCFIEKTGASWNVQEVKAPVGLNLQP